MKSIFGSNDVLIAKNLTRRDFLKAGVGSAAVICGLEMFAGCATTETPKKRINQAKKKSDYKVYSPKTGCLIGFYKEQYRNFQMGSSISTVINHYKHALGTNPSIIAYWSFLSLGFPMTEAETISKNGVFPYISIMPGHERWQNSFSTDDIVQGRCDRYIKRLAASALDFGTEYGSFFFTTMIEPNGSVWPWQGKPTTIPAMKHIWQIFEDKGTNQYATWVWEAFCPERYEKSFTDPEPYYPGDKYVDWIGINVFANLKNPYISEKTLFKELMHKTYEQMFVNHPQKPIMVSEFGRTPGDNQPLWLIDAYKSIKNDFSPIKAAIYYDNITGVHTGQDHTLDQKSLQTLKEILKDPYWIMATNN